MKRILNNKGFTLTELMIVVAIIGILATIAIPNYLVMLPHLRLKSAATDVASAMQHARMTAIAKNADQTITFNTGAGTGTFEYGDLSSHDWRDVEVYNEGGPLAGGVPNCTSYTFQTDGTVAGGAGLVAVYLQNISDPTRHYRVTVDSLSGIIKIQEYSVNAWAN